MIVTDLSYFSGAFCFNYLLMGILVDLSYLCILIVNETVPKWCGASDEINLNVFNFVCRMYLFHAIALRG